MRKQQFLGKLTLVALGVAGYSALILLKATRALFLAAPIVWRESLLIGIAITVPCAFFLGFCCLLAMRGILLH